MLLNLLVILNLALLSTASVGQGEILPFQNATTVLFVDSLYNTVELFPDRSHVKTRDVVSLALLPTAASSLDSGASRYNLDVANPLTPIVPCSDGVYCCPSSDDCYPDLGMCCIKGGVTCGYQTVLSSGPLIYKPHLRKGLALALKSLFSRSYLLRDGNWSPQSGSSELCALLGDLHCSGASN